MTADIVCANGQHGLRHALLMVLGQRFGAPVPADLVAAIEAQSDADVLSQ